MLIPSSVKLLALLVLHQPSFVVGSGVVRKRQGGVCSRSSSGPPIPSASSTTISSSQSSVSVSTSSAASSSASGSTARSSSESGIPTTSESDSPAPSASGGADGGNHPIPDIPYRSYIYRDPETGSGGGHRIRILGREDLCLTVQNENLSAGSAVKLSYCVSDTASDLNTQLFDYDDSYSAQYELHGNPSLCLDALDVNASGFHDSLGISECSKASFPYYQFLVWTNRGTIGVPGQSGDAPNQCLAVNRDSQPSGNSLKAIGTATCDSADPYQMFYTYEGPNVGSSA